MAKDLATQISDWCSNHEDGEFVRLPVTHPYSITVPSTEARYVLFTTKPASVLHIIEQQGAGQAVQVVGRSGLPNDGDARWLQSLAGSRPLVFLGDNDPAALLTFLWIRWQIEVSYAGVSDRLMQKFHARVADAATIRLTDAETAALLLLRAPCPDYHAFLGTDCAALLEAGHKIEIEAALGLASDQGSLIEAIAGA